MSYQPKITIYLVTFISGFLDGSVLLQMFPVGSAASFRLLAGGLV